MNVCRPTLSRVRCGRDSMVVGFTTTYVISVYHHWCEFESRSGRGDICDKVCQWFATGRWFSPGPPFSSTNKTDRHDIAEILLKVALNSIKQTNKQTTLTFRFSPEPPSNTHTYSINETFEHKYKKSVMVCCPVILFNNLVYLYSYHSTVSTGLFCNGSITGEIWYLILLHIYQYTSVPDWFICLVDCVKRHFQQYFSYIVAVSFIDGGNRKTRRKPPTCLLSLTNFITECCTPRPDRDSNSQHQWW